MPGFNIDTTGATSQNIVFADNVDFSGSTAPTPKVTTNGQLLVGSTASPHIQVGTITSPGGTVTIGYSSPNITLDITGTSNAIEKINVDVTTGGGTNPVLPLAGAITMTGGIYASGTFGTRVIAIDSTAPNTLAVQAQISSAVAASLSTANGFAHFNSANFTVDANGFVTSRAMGTTWSVKNANFNAAASNGYFITGNAIATLPAAPTIGDTIAFFVQGAFTVTITGNVGQAIQIASNLSSAAGTQANTASGDACTLVYDSTNTQWNAVSFVGAWNKT